MLIRLATLEDAQSISEIYAPYVNETAISFEIEAPTAEQMAERMATSHYHYPWLVCSINERLLGYAYACAFRKREAYQWATEVSVYVGQNNRHAGIGSALYKKLLNVLKIQGFTQALAGMTLPNQASEALHLKLGFEHFADFKDVGFKRNQWHSTRFFRLQLNEPSVPMTQPTSIQNIDKQIIDSA